MRSPCLTLFCTQIVLVPLCGIIHGSSYTAHVVTAYAREHEPCIIFMDEIDAIGARRFSEGNSSDREIQRTLMEVCRASFRVLLAILVENVVFFDAMGTLVSSSICSC